MSIAKKMMIRGASIQHIKYNIAVLRRWKEPPSEMDSHVLDILDDVVSYLKHLEEDKKNE